MFQCIPHSLSLGNMKQFAVIVDLRKKTFFDTSRVVLQRLPLSLRNVAGSSLFVFKTFLTSVYQTKRKRKPGDKVFCCDSKK